MGQDCDCHKALENVLACKLLYSLSIWDSLRHVFPHLPAVAAARRSGRGHFMSFLRCANYGKYMLGTYNRPSVSIQQRGFMFFSSLDNPTFLWSFLSIHIPILSLDPPRLSIPCGNIRFVRCNGPRKDIEPRTPNVLTSQQQQKCFKPFPASSSAAGQIQNTDMN